MQTCEPTNARKHYRQRRKSSYRTRPQEEWVGIPAPAIVDLAVQAAAQATLARLQRASRGSTRHQYLLAGLLRCGLTNPETGELCFRSMNSTTPVHHHPANARAHHCTRYYDLPDGRRRRCANRIKSNEIEPLVWNCLVSALRHPEVLREQMQEANGIGPAVTTRLAQDLAAARTAVQAAQEKLDRLLDLHLEGVLDAETYTRRQATLVTERDGAAANVADVERQLGGLETVGCEK